MSDHTPRFACSDAARLAAEVFGIHAEAAPLPSERDQNFALTERRGGKFVLKISKSDEQRAVLDFQNAALGHLAERRLCVVLPQVVPSLRGADITAVTDAHGRRFDVRLVTWLEGEVLAKVPHTEALLGSLGRVLAELDAGLADFTHVAMHRELQWDLRHVARALEHVGLLSADEQGLVRYFQPEWEEVRWQELRTSVIHGDANDYNVLVRHGRVSGLIDFGDMVHSALVCDPAIACAYAMLGESDPLEAAVTVALAYHERYALTASELDALFPLIVARLCMSVCYAASNAMTKSSDAYQQISKAPVLRLLGQLAAVPKGLAQATLSDACTARGRVLERRRRLLGSNLRLSYREPLQIVRGSMQYLYDERGRRYLDAYNNVPHVGHCNPAVVRAGQAQMATLNTNTRYLHPLVNAYAERLAATLPKELEVCYFVNSGSEANELALRLARTHTRATDLIVLEHAYHGNTTTLIEVSPYKHDGPGGVRAPSWLHVAPLPDTYRGRYRASDGAAGEKYAGHVEEIIARLKSRGRSLAGFIAESWPSVAGQLALAPGYLAAVYRAVRAVGGLCIADEVQTGYGRLGRHFWGFEAYGVIPDIVVLGKPIGNGHPIAAVVTTRAVAASFDNGMEFFSTFGGNTVSCAIGLAVLECLEQEHLQEHAHAVGSHLLAALGALKSRCPLIGDVRGSGLFLGVELVRDRCTLEPDGAAASFLVNRLREDAVLIGTEGPHHNVLKIRPPMPFTVPDADLLIDRLSAGLAAYGDQ